MTMMSSCQYVVFLLYISSIILAGADYLGCSLPYKCTFKSECIQLHKQTGSLGNRFLFPCSRRQNFVCCPPVTNEYSSGDLTTRLNTTAVNISRQKLSEHKNIKLLPENCGVSLANKIFAGEDSAPGEYPWMALIVFKDSETGKDIYNCGGTLINERYVLTAAHCFDNPNNELSHVRLGEFQISVRNECNSFGECNEPADIPVERKIIHEQWFKDEGLLRNDIALLRLARNAPDSRSDISPVCLPLNITELNITNSTELEAAGWGITTFDDEVPQNSDLLQKTSFSNNEDECNFCKVKHRYCPLIPGQMCIQGTRNRDVCKGDSGGPLMVTHNARTYQLGITSYKTSICGTEGVPSIFTRVASYARWILDKLEP